MSATPAGYPVYYGSAAPLFSFIGTQYGGDGINTFAVPDLRGYVAMGASGSQPAGARIGAETVTLTPDNLPLHGHGLAVSNNGSAAATNQPNAAVVPSVASTNQEGNPALTGTFPTRS